ncbi:MAG: hypothetical protein WKG01_00100 [Kofleriaceae bacterium]
MSRYLAMLLFLTACSSESFEPWEIDDLDDAQGFSLRVPEFEVPSGRESQNCYFVTVPDLANGADVWVDRILTAMNPGSHHMNVFRVKTIENLDPAAGVPVTLGKYDGTLIEGSDEYATNPCWDSANWSDWPLVANSQHATIESPLTEWKLPEDVAIRLTPGERLMVQTHYVNSTDQPTKWGAKVGINFYRQAESKTPVELGSLFATQQNIRICRSAPKVTYSGTCKFPNDVTITAANGHFHKRGQQFSIFPWSGTSTQHPDPATLMYQSNDWSHPPMATDIGVVAPANTGIWWDCAYQWSPPSDTTCDAIDDKDPSANKDCCYTFGGNTDVGEHCNVFLYYYPKVDTDIFCL